MISSPRTQELTLKNPSLLHLRIFSDCYSGTFVDNVLDLLNQRTVLYWTFIYPQKASVLLFLLVLMISMLNQHSQRSTGLDNRLCTARLAVNRCKLKAQKFSSSFSSWWEAQTRIHEGIWRNLTISLLPTSSKLSCFWPDCLQSTCNDCPQQVFTSNSIFFKY